VAIDGARLLVSAPGRLEAYVIDVTSGGFALDGVLRPAADEVSFGNMDPTDMNFGHHGMSHRVAIEGGLAVVSVPDGPARQNILDWAGPGAAYAFARRGSTPGDMWQRTSKLRHGYNLEDRFFHSVALDQGTLYALRRPTATVTEHTDLDSGTYELFGAGCSGSLGVSRTMATALPRIGHTMSVDFTNLPLGLAFFVFGWSNTAWSGGALPIDLGLAGATGCPWRVSLDSVSFLAGPGNTATYSLAIPNDPSFLDAKFYTQSLLLDPGWNPLGGVSSDAAVAVVGR
jgi:hypothetical protein